jgi:hypothetical protein
VRDLPREGSVKEPAEIFYFGCRDDGPGHFWWGPGFSNRHLYPRGERARLFGKIDGGFAPKPEVVGHAKVSHVERWTVLAWWDRSVDSRSASNSALVVQGTYHFASMITLLGIYFPTVARRQMQEIKCVEEPEFDDEPSHVTEKV